MVPSAKGTDFFEIDATGGGGGDAIGFDLSRINASGVSVINLAGNTGGGLMTLISGDGGNSASDGVGLGGYGGVAMLLRVSGIESNVTLNMSGIFQARITGGEGGTTSGGYNTQDPAEDPLPDHPTATGEVSLGGDGGRAYAISTETPSISFIKTNKLALTAQATAASSTIVFTISDAADLAVTSGDGGADILIDFGGGGDGGEAFGIYLGNSAGDITFNHSSTGFFNVTAGAGGHAGNAALPVGNEDAQGGEGGAAKLISALGGYSGVADIDHSNTGTWTIIGGAGGESNGVRADDLDPTVRALGGGSAGHGGLATAIDFNGAVVSSLIDIVLEGGQVLVTGRCWR